MSFRVYNQIPCLPCIPGITGATGSTGTVFQTRVYNIETNMTGIVGGPTGIEIDVGDADDDNFEVALPFPVTFLNNTYTSVYIGSNSYLTFESGSDVFFNIDGFNPPLPGLLINANDNSLQKYYLDLSEGDTKFTIRFEGTLNKHTSPGLEWVWQVSFYKNNSNIDIAWISPNSIQNVNGTDGIFKISSGNGSVQNLPKTNCGVLLTPQTITYKNIRVSGGGVSIIYNNDVRTSQVGEGVGTLNIQPLGAITVDTSGDASRLGSNNFLTIKNANDLTIQTTVDDNKCSNIDFSTQGGSIKFQVDTDHTVNIARPIFVILNNTNENIDTLYIDDNRFIKKFI